MSPQLQRLVFLFAFAGLFAVSADFACNDDSCPTERGGQYQTMDEISHQQVETLADALVRSKIALDDVQRSTLETQGHLLGVVDLDRPVKHPDGTVEMPRGWLPEIPPGHPWYGRLTPADDAFYSWFEERVLDARLFDPANPEHVAFAEAYLAKARTNAPQFTGWTFASPTECPKKTTPTK